MAEARVGRPQAPTVTHSTSACSASCGMRCVCVFYQVEKKLVASHSTSEPQPKIEFDIPYRELKFTGVPGKSSVDIMPTVHRSAAHNTLTTSTATTSTRLSVRVSAIIPDRFFVAHLSARRVRGVLSVWWRWTTLLRWSFR